MATTKTTTATSSYIKCPYCGGEYVPSEIFMPSEIEGKTEDIIKDPVGKILYVSYQEGYEPLTAGRYTCDACNRSFVVEPTVSYKVRKEAEEIDFSVSTSSLLD